MAQQNEVPLQTPPAPLLNPQIAKDLKAYEIAMEELNYAREEIKKLAAALQHMKNPLYGVQMVMSEVMNMGGAQISSLSALDNVDTDLRNILQDGQNGFNSAQNDNSDPSNPNMTTPQQKADGEKFKNSLDQLENFLKWQQSLGKNSIIDGGTLKTMLSAISSIKNLFNGPANWNGGNIGHHINGWTKQQNGQYSPELKTIQDSLQTLTQSTSALSTTTNTELQFRSEQYKQYLGIDQSSIQSYLKLTSAMIQNQKTS